MLVSFEFSWFEFVLFLELNLLNVLFLILLFDFVLFELFLVWGFDITLNLCDDILELLLFVLFDSVIIGISLLDVLLFIEGRFELLVTFTLFVFEFKFLAFILFLVEFTFDDYIFNYFFILL